MSVGGFQDFCEDIETRYDEQVRASGVAWRKQQRGQQRQQSVELDRSIESQVTSTSLF